MLRLDLAFLPYPVYNTRLYLISMNRSEYLRCSRASFPDHGQPVKTMALEEEKPFPLDGIMVLSDIDETVMNGTVDSSVYTLQEAFHLLDDSREDLRKYYNHFDKWPGFFGVDKNYVLSVIANLFQNPASYDHPSFIPGAKESYGILHSLGAKITFHTARKGRDDKTHHKIQKKTVRAMKNYFQIADIHVITQGMHMAKNKDQYSSGNDIKGVDWKIMNASGYRNLGFKVILVDDHDDVCRKAAMMGIPAVLVAYPYNKPKTNDSIFTRNKHPDRFSVNVPPLMRVIDDISQLPQAVLSIRKNILKPFPGFTYPVSQSPQSWQEKLSFESS